MGKPRENPFGPTNGDLKRGLEFDKDEYMEIDEYCKEKNIIWFASPWNLKSVDFLEEFNIPCYKIASPSLTDDELLLKIKETKKPIILSTGMSTIEQIDHAVKVLKGSELIILHCTSTYPSKAEELNLKCIKTLAERYKEHLIGYSGHEPGILPSTIAVAHGTVLIERHITLNRTLWGSDQTASLEPKGMELLVRDIRLVPTYLGNGKKRVFESEKPILGKLRKIK